MTADTVPQVPTAGRAGLVEAAALVVALGVAELVSAGPWTLLGLWLHAALLAALIVRAALAADPRQARFYLAAAVLPLVRLLSLAVAPHAFGGVWRYVVPEALVLVAGLSLAHALQLSGRAMGVQWPRRGWAMWLAVASGLLGGWLVGRVLHVVPLAGALAAAGAWWWPVLFLLLAGFAEELTFRGVVQPVAVEWLGPVAGVAFMALSWGLLQVGWGSPLDVLIACGLGAVWGWARQRDGSLLGPAVAHGLANVLVFAALPFLR